MATQADADRSCGEAGRIESEGDDPMNEERPEDKAAREYSERVQAADAEAERRAEREVMRITRERLIEEGPWRPIGDRGSVSIFVRPGVSIVVRFDPVTGGRIATVLEVSSGSSSPEVHLYSMADLDDLMRLYNHPALPSLMFSAGEPPIT